ncbi:nuclear valosin-containing protein-like, partial [Heterodontus francisci]|uniref:nuclear valosin-containing protein-like n=1 Tax=Heterodontus francisci TaxID=7792 RepID=UPI00355B37CA
FSDDYGAQFSDDYGAQFSDDYGAKFSDDYGAQFSDYGAQFSDDYGAQFSDDYEAQFRDDYGAQFSDDHEAQFSDDHEFSDYGAQFSDDYGAQFSDDYEAQFRDDYGAQFSDDHEAQFSDDHEAQFNIIDPAILRPGRLDKTLYVGLPLASDRFAILQTLTKFGTRPPMDPDVDLFTIATDQRCNCFTGADLSALVREASVNALREYLSHRSPEAASSSCSGMQVAQQHFEAAFKKVKPSVSKKDLLVYELLQQSLSQ